MNQPSDHQEQDGNLHVQPSNSPRDSLHSEFDATKPDAGPAMDSDWWPESNDGQCSEHAALFAASQSAPLNVV